MRIFILYATFTVAALAGYFRQAAGTRLFFTGTGYTDPIIGEQPAYSALWGKRGEKWDRRRIPDFTSSGYREGKTAIPTYPVKINVKKMGAAGDGKKDDTRAFRNAIQACAPGGTVLVPEGIYRLTDTVMITQNGVCIHGAGTGKTTLHIEKGLEELYPRYNENTRQTAWSWSGAMLLFSGNVSGCGVQDLTILFPDDAWSNHDFHEKAYNAIGFSDGAHDNWVKNVRITGPDVGIWIEGSAHHITAEDWILDFGPQRKQQHISGHHGLNIYGGYNLFQRFRIEGKFWHDLSVESANSVHNVFRSGSGTDLCIDHHNHAQRNNLFTNLNAGLGTRLYFSGGKEAPLGICFNETFWNIRSINQLAYCDQKNDPRGRSMNNVCVGLKTSLPSVPGNSDGNWFETIDPAVLYPQDLYDAQLKRNQSGK